MTHSLEQARMFFSLAPQLNYNVEEVKRRAKKRFKATCFNELSVSEMNWLIEKLLLKLEEKQKYIR